MRLAPALLVAISTACAAPRVEPRLHTLPSAPPSDPVVVGPTAAEPPEVPMEREPAIARAKELAAAWKDAPKYQRASAELPGWIEKNHVDATELRKILEALTKSCLAAKDREDPACTVLTDFRSAQTEPELEPLIEAMVELLGETAPIAAGPSPVMRVLVKLDARGYYRADMAIDRILERRFLAQKKSCAAPTAEQIAAADANLEDFFVVGAQSVRKPTKAERADLAYLYASLSSSGEEVGKGPVTPGAKLTKEHPDVLRRVELGKSMKDALAEGDLEEHANAAKAYLTTLGFPGPIREDEEGDHRWGGAGYSFVMRDLARSLEILGRYEEAESLYRRTNPGGGMCGSSTHTRRDDQIEGIIRTSEMRQGCSRSVAERLFAIGLDLHDSYGPDVLATAGFDVPKLYRGALLALGRSNRDALDKALQGSPFSAEGAARLARLGTEAWGDRLRAIEGYADTEKAASLDRLVEIATTAGEEDQVKALKAIGTLAEDRGWDPCSSRFGWGRGSSGGRDVAALMRKCETKLPQATLDKLVTSVSGLTKDPSPKVREAVAETLGMLGSPKARPALEKLAKDKHDAGGQICTTDDKGKNHCEKHLPVARAAKEGLQSIAEAERHRKDDRKAAKATTAKRT